MLKMSAIGHLGKDCIVKEVNGKNVINFTVAHTEKFKDAQGVLKEKTTWLECAYWSDRVAIAPYLLKGTQVYVEGSPSADGYIDKNNQARATLRLRVDKIELLGSKQGNGGGGNQQSAAPSAPAPQSQNNSTMNDAADDLPF